MRKNKDELLVEYLINEGKKMGMSAVEYALSEYNSEDFEKVYKQKEYMADYMKDYYPEHKDYWKEWKDKTKGMYVYLLLNDKNNVIWVGSSTELYNRLQVHKNSGRKFETVMLYDFTNCDITDKEMRQIEYYYQDLYKKHLEEDCRVVPYNKEELIKVQEKVKDVKPIMLREFNVNSILKAIGRK